jgi:hypothetical protein
MEKQRPAQGILKSGKKVKGTTTTHAKQFFTSQLILDDLDNLNNIPFDPSLLFHLQLYS